MARAEDELANTAVARPAAAVASRPDSLGLTRTAAADPSEPATPPRTIRELGRLRLEGVLGSGGMGAVYAAFDPDLERRVAVKLLHARSDDARARLLREARAMAKLSHPNVIAVFDVGTVDGEDFVAMELIDGETLGDWRARAHPTWRETVAAFVQAGRGLAAAHAAGLVHRDFKPSNALRAHGGRVVVTDFGLSRGAMTPDDASSADAAPAATASGSGSTGPVTLTATGALLGTPAYMAPEQWTGASVSPATDQFAFCVALAEALAGTRPFGGETLEKVRAGALAGPGPLDGVPGAVRAIVRRGLAVDPAARWPSMTVLLDALERALGRRRRRVTLAAALVVGAAGTVGLLAATRTPPAPPAVAAASDCLPPVLDPERVSGEIAPTPIAPLLGGELAAWRSARVAACHASPATRAARLSCLDGVLARLDLVARQAASHPIAGAGGVEGAGAILADASLCARDRPPHLATSIDPQLEHAFDAYRDAVAGLPVPDGPVPDEPCAAAMTLRARQLATDLSSLDIAGLMEIGRAGDHYLAMSSRCNDDDLIKAFASIGGARSSASVLGRIESVANSVPQADISAELDLVLARFDGVAQPDHAIATFEQAIERFGSRHRPRSQLRAVLGIADLLLQRGRPADLARVDELVARWTPGAVDEDARALAQRAAFVRWRRGDVAGADAALIALGHVVTHDPVMKNPLPPVDASGVVVDEHGHPVAGAEVVAAVEVDADSARAASPFSWYRPVVAHAGDDGHFAIPAARGYLTASSGDLRSEFVAAAAGVRLVVEPTVRVAGRVALGDSAGTALEVEIEGRGVWDEIAPVGSDGAFTLDHVLRGKLSVRTRSYGVTRGGTAVAVDARHGVDGVALVAQPAHPLFVIGRGTGVDPPPMAILWMGRGHAPAHATLRAIGASVVDRFTAFPPLASAVPDTVRPKLEADDLFGTFAARDDGPLFVCANAVSTQMFDAPSAKAMATAFADAELGCTDVKPTDDVVVVEVPPMRKLRVP